jgi:lipid II:glycine glycyltransferase (peptidoglycan interpeptide bridge formation enzyme)
MIASLDQWNNFTASHPETHLLQTGAWGELKSSFGWKPVRIIVDVDGAQILFKRLPGGLSVAYVPRGPVGRLTDTLLAEIDLVCREERAVFLKLEPDAWAGEQPDLVEKAKSWHPARTIQPRRTILISLTQSEDELLAAMKQKTRYNIRLAEKKLIVIRPSDDLETFHKMMLVTGARDGIGAHARSYYEKAYQLYHPTGQCELLFAYFEDQPIAAVMIFAAGKTAWYVYGASTEIERNRMPTYLLQWEAIRWAKQHGYSIYDLWGIPDVDEAELEEKFTQKGSHEGLWGVYRFKRGFGGDVRRSIGAWDRVYRPVLYSAYSLLMKLRGRQED